MRTFGIIAICAIFAVCGCSRPTSAPPTIPSPPPIIELAPATEPPSVVPPLIQKGTLFESQVIKAEPDPGFEVPSVKRVSSILPRPGCGCGMRFVEIPTEDEILVQRWGIRAFPAYAAILGDPASDIWDVIGVCYAIGDVKAARGQFIPLLVNRLTAPDALVQPGVTLDAGIQFGEGRAVPLRNMVRSSVTYLLGEIGSEREAEYIRPFLHQEETSLQYAAVWSLTRIGEKWDHEVVEIWLSNLPPLQNRLYTERVRKWRIEREARIKSDPARRTF
jgi:hypothetical protein